MNDDILKEILSEMKNIKLGMNEVNKRLEGIEQKIDRIEENTPADIMALLRNIDEKMEDRDSAVQALNKRVFKTESIIERITKQ
jgi:uncharacterized protein (DUF885 family)